MNAWVVTVKVDYEGESLVGLYAESNREGAEEACHDVMHPPGEGRRGASSVWELVEDTPTQKHWKCTSGVIGSGYHVAMELWEVHK